MNKKIIFLTLLGLGFFLAIFWLWPKNSSSLDDDFTADFSKKTFYENRICKCLGFENVKSDVCDNCRADYICWGIPLFCKNECRSKIDNVWQDVSCQ